MIQQRPTERLKEYGLVRSLRSSGSTVVWAENLTTGEMYHLLRWGNMFYLPVEAGDHIGIGLYNDSRLWKAYPTYVEALNIWEGGQSEPEDCDTDHMWELQPWRQHMVDALMNPYAQAGRPFIITRSGAGLAIGESTFGTAAYRGQIRVYERNELESRRPVHPYGANPPPWADSFGLEGAIGHGVGPVFPGGMPADRKETLGPEEGPAAIGAGEEEYRPHEQTGMMYMRHADLLISLQVELRKDLQPMLNRAWGKGWSWFWPRPHGERWFDEPWTWSSPRRRTSSQVPVIRPHTGKPRAIPS